MDVTKENVKKLAELITHPEPEYSRQGRMIFVDLNLGSEGTMGYSTPLLQT